MEIYIGGIQVLTGSKGKDFIGRLGMWKGIKVGTEVLLSCTYCGIILC